MVSNYDIAKMFAAGRTKGRTKNVFIEGDTIYSYGHHFPIAKREPRLNGFLFNPLGYSSSTAKHKSNVRSALSGMDIVEVKNADLRYAREQIEANKRDIMQKQQKAARARSQQRRMAYLSDVAYKQSQNEKLKRFII